MEHGSDKCQASKGKRAASRGRTKSMVGRDFAKDTASKEMTQGVKASKEPLHTVNKPQNAARRNKEPLFSSHVEIGAHRDTRKFLPTS